MFRNNEPVGVRVNTRTGPASAQLLGPPWWTAGLYLAFALIAQIEIAHDLTVRGAELSTVLVVVVWYALRTDLYRAALFGLIAGLCEDAFSTQTGGAWTLSTTLTALFAGWLARWFFADSIPVVTGVVIAATLLRRMLFWIVMALQGYPSGFARVHLHEALWESLVNAAFVAVVMAIGRVWEMRAVRSK